MESPNCLIFSMNEVILIAHKDHRIREFIGNLSSEILLVAHINAASLNFQGTPKNAHKIRYRKT